MASKRKLKTSVKVCIGLLVLFLLGLLWVFFGPKKVVEEPIPTPTPTIAPTPKPAHQLDEELLKEKYDLLKKDEEINSEVKGLLFFESGILEQPVLQSGDNVKYLEINWEDMQYRSYGSAFMDFRNDLTIDDQNTIVYGHYVYQRRSPDDRTLMFTPLALLREEENYEDNKYIVLVTDEDIRYYEITYVYDCPLVQTEYGDLARDDLQFNMIDYDEEYFKTYINSINDVELYDTGLELEYEDKFLSLQTCIEFHEESRQIIVCREIERIEIPKDWKE